MEDMSKVSKKPLRPFILAPAGNKASFLAALAAGADAVYCGLKHLSARMEAVNFSLEELFPLVQLAHDKDVRVYVALNALLKDEDLNRTGKILEQLDRQIKPDGIIIQDLSILNLVKQTGYSGEVHLSTLANVSFGAAIKLIQQKFDVHKVVLPRELNIAIRFSLTAWPAPFKVVLRPIISPASGFPSK